MSQNVYTPSDFICALQVNVIWIFFFYVPMTVWRPLRYRNETLICHWNRHSDMIMSVVVVQRGRGGMRTRDLNIIIRDVWCMYIVDSQSVEVYPLYTAYEGCTGGVRTSLSAAVGFWTGRYEPLYCSRLSRRTRVLCVCSVIESDVLIIIITIIWLIYHLSFLLFCRKTVFDWVTFFVSDVVSTRSSTCCGSFQRETSHSPVLTTSVVRVHLSRLLLPVRLTYILLVHDNTHNCKY